MSTKNESIFPDYLEWAEGSTAEAKLSTLLEQTDSAEYKTLKNIYSLILLFNESNPSVPFEAYQKNTLNKKELFGSFLATLLTCVVLSFISKDVEFINQSIKNIVIVGATTLISLAAVADHQQHLNNRHKQFEPIRDRLQVLGMEITQNELAQYLSYIFWYFKQQEHSQTLLSVQNTHD